MVISTVNQVVYNGDGVTTAFPFTFRIIEATDIKLLLIDADGAETDITADYYVDTVNNTVYYPGYAPGAEPPAEDQPPKVQTGQKLVVYRELPITQEKDLGEKWPFYVIELALDKLTMILQQIFDWWGRTLKISQGGSVDGFDTNVYPEAGKVIAVNEDGDGFEAKTAMLEENNAWEGKGMQIKNIAGPTSVTDAVTKDYVDQILNGFVLAGDSRTVPFDTLAQLRVADIAAGQIAFTLGYHDINDGGAGVYTIRTATLSDVDDGGSVIILDNGNVAELIVEDTINVKQFGAVGDGVTDDSDALKSTLDFANAANVAVYIPKGLYICKVSLDSTVNMYGEGTRSAIRWVEDQATGLTITDAFCRDLCFEMTNDFSGKLLYAKSTNPGSYPVTLSLERLSFASDNTDYVGTMLYIEMYHTYGGYFNDIKLKRYSYYWANGISDRCEYGVVFTAAPGSWVTGCCLENFIIDLWAKKPLTILGQDNGYSSDIYLINCQIQCRHSTQGWKHEYMTRVAYIGRMRIINCKIWDYGSQYCENAVIYYSCANLTSWLSPLYDKYYFANIDPFTIEGAVNVYEESAKAYYSRLNSANMFEGSPQTVALGEDDTKLVPIYIPAGTYAAPIIYEIELCTSYNYATGSYGGDAYLYLKFMGHKFNKNILYQYNVTTLTDIVYKIKRYKSGVVIWCKGGRNVYMNMISYGKPYVATGKTVKDVDDNDETLTLLNVADYSPCPHSKDLAIVSGYVIDENTIVNSTTDGAASAPASGTHAVGEIVYNSAPAAGGNIGWVCVTAGTPGTWKSFGTIEA